MTLGELIDQLKKVKDKTKPVKIQPGDRNPDGFDSWRGSYDELALGYGGNQPVTVKELIKQAKAANGKTFCGWKGGEFEMSLHTEVWIDNPGEYHECPLETVIEDTESVNIYCESNSSVSERDYEEIAEQFGQDVRTIRQIHMALLSVSS